MQTYVQIKKPQLYIIIIQKLIPFSGCTDLVFCKKNCRLGRPVEEEKSPSELIAIKSKNQNKSFTYPIHVW